MEGSTEGQEENEQDLNSHGVKKSGITGKKRTLI